MEKYSYDQAVDEAFKIEDRLIDMDPDNYKIWSKGQYETAYQQIKQEALDHSKEVAGLRFTSAELRKLSEGLYGLRHVSDLVTAEREMEEGAEGDSLAISNSLSLVPQEKRAQIIERFPIKNFPKDLFVSEIGQNLAWKVISEEEKQQLVLNFEQAVKKFIANSLGWDINKLIESTEITVGQIIDLFIKSQPSFVLIEFDEAMKGHGYDEENYYGLGKLGKGMIERDQMKDKVALAAEDFSGLDLDSQTMMDGKLFGQIISFASQKLFFKIYKTIVLEINSV